MKLAVLQHILLSFFKQVSQKGKSSSIIANILYTLFDSSSFSLITLYFDAPPS